MFALEHFSYLLTIVAIHMLTIPTKYNDYANTFDDWANIYVDFADTLDRSSLDH
jgi:hypothetical protein